MVLTKLFNIFSITASMGSGLLTTPTRTPTRDVTNITINLDEYADQTTIGTQYQQLQIINEDEDNQQTIEWGMSVNEYTFNNQYINGKIRRVSVSTTIEGFNNNGIYEYSHGIIINKKVENTNGGAISWALEGQDPVMCAPHQELWFIKINTMGAIYDVKIGHNYIVEIPSPQLTQQGVANGYTSAKMVYKNLTIENEEIETYLNTNNIEDYLTQPSKTLYGTYGRIQNTIAQYNTTEVKGSYNLQGTISSFNANRLTYDQQINVGNYKDKSTYYMQFFQPYLIDPNIPYANFEKPTYGMHTEYGNITITAKRSNVNVTTEVIDVPGVMFDVLGMPFTFISTAFNLTLFAGTPYAINISTLFLSIIAVLVFVFLIKIIIAVFVGKG